MGVMEAIKRGFGIANRNIKLIILLFVFNIVGMLVRLPFAPATPGATVPPVLVIIGIVFGLLGVLVFGGILGSLKDFIKTQTSSLASFISYGAKFYLRILKKKDAPKFDEVNAWYRGLQAAQVVKICMVALDAGTQKLMMGWAVDAQHPLAVSTLSHHGLYSATFKRLWPAAAS